MAWRVGVGSLKWHRPPLVRSSSPWLPLFLPLLSLTSHCIATSRVEVSRRPVLWRSSHMPVTACIRGGDISRRCPDPHMLLRPPKLSKVGLLVTLRSHPVRCLVVVLLSPVEDQLAHCALCSKFNLLLLLRLGSDFGMCLCLCAPLPCFGQYSTRKQ